MTHCGVILQGLQAALQPVVSLLGCQCSTCNSCFLVDQLQVQRIHTSLQALMGRSKLLCVLPRLHIAAVLAILCKQQRRYSWTACCCASALPHMQQTC